MCQAEDMCLCVMCVQNSPDVWQTPLSLLINLQPLPESQYNSSPETMGYRLRVQRTDGQAEDRTEEVGGTAGGVSEATVENLDPWTKYQAQIQAYNSIGPGPWSSPVTSHTTESGMSKDLTRVLFAKFQVQLSCQCCNGRA